MESLIAILLPFCCIERHVRILGYETYNVWCSIDSPQRESIATRETTFTLTIVVHVIASLYIMYMVKWMIVDLVLCME